MNAPPCSLGSILSQSRTPEKGDPMNRMWSEFLCRLAIVLALLGINPPCWGRTTASLTADFRHSPAWWQTSICLPDDWQKTLVGKEGTLLYDHPGPFNSFNTRIGFDLAEGCEWIGQELVSPRTPIVRTTKRSGPFEIAEETFAVAPPLRGRAAKGAGGLLLERLDRTRYQTNWASPPRGSDPAFTSIAVNWGHPIRYRFRAADSAGYTVVFGLCEGHQKEAGQRVLDLKIEGKTRRTVDMVAEKGRNVPAAFTFAARDDDENGWIDLEVAAASKSVDKNPFLNVLWVFAAGVEPNADDFLTGTPAAPPLAYHNCGMHLGSPRNDILLVRIRNTGETRQTIQPTVVVESQFPFTVDFHEDEFLVGEHLAIETTLDCEEIESTEKKHILRLREKALGAGKELTFAVGVATGEPRVAAPRSVRHAESLRRKAVRYWKELDLPYDRIQVPDEGIQALVDSSIRNIFQAREIKGGLPSYQVGPTVYRGLWVVDGAFLLEAMTFLGQVDDVRNGVQYMLSHQRDDGGFTLIDKYWKESGIVLWAVTRHARLTGDKEWLRGVWPKLEAAFGFIRKLRDEASDDPEAPHYRLLPAGFPDGGLGGRDEPEYTNVYWTMVGMRAAIDAARWLGRDDQAEDWQREYDDFRNVFRHAAAQDMRTDPHGNRYLPIIMGNKGNHLPQRAQWAFCHAVFPGKVFTDDDDALVRGNMAMLAATEREGMVYGTGWMKEGLWNYFASFYGHAWLWLGEGRKAAEVLYAFANHASPLLVWCEEQTLADAEEAKKHGDMPHNWASAEFIRLVRHLLVLERGRELHLFEGLPAEWARPGAVTRLRDVLTEFGPISLELRVADDGKTARLRVDPPSRDRPERLVVHLGEWADRDNPEATMELPATGSIDREIRIR